MGEAGFGNNRYCVEQVEIIFLRFDFQSGEREDAERFVARANFVRAAGWPRGVARGFRRGTHGAAGKLDSPDEKVKMPHSRTIYGGLLFIRVSITAI